MSNYCEKHELTNCAICNGAAARLEESFAEPAIDRGSLPYIPGGVTIFAKFPGRCAGCNEPYGPNTAIFRPHGGDVGWVVVECCA